MLTLCKETVAVYCEDYIETHKHTVWSELEILYSTADGIYITIQL